MSYYPYGQGPYPDDASQQHPYSAASYPHTQPFSLQQSAPSTVPGLFSNSVQSSFDQNQSSIPGLSFPAYEGGWQVQQGPSLIPANQYYPDLANAAKQQNQQQQNGAQTDTYPAGYNATQNGAATRTSNGVAEEGEIGEGEYDDFYEPAEAVVNEDVQMESGEVDSYEPQEPRQADATAEENGSSRERSGSYSPYLSPREIRHAPNIQPAPAHVDRAKQFADAKDKARVAIKNLLPLKVHYQNYIDAGIEPSVVKGLFDELGLETATSTPDSQKPGIPGLSARSRPHPAAAAASSTSKMSQPAATTSSKSPAAVASAVAADAAAAPTDPSESRKDRIARLLAAKQAKSASTPQAQPAQATAGSKTAPNQDKKAPGSASAEKMLKLQAKMAALQKASEAQSQKAEAILGQESAKGIAPGGSSYSNTATKAPASGVRAAGHSTSSIPGLPMTSAAPSPAAPTSRKRPVAADFVDDVTSGEPKRPFGQNRSEKFVIDVSDASDDEDVEMEIGSVEDSPQLARRESPLQRTTSFRDIPPLPDSVLTRQVSSPGANSTSTPPNGGLAEKVKEIEEMKARIMMAEARRKLVEKTRSQKASNAAQPTSRTPDAVDSPEQRQAEATGIETMTGQSSPATADAGPLKLPKLSQMSEAEKSSRRDRVRTLSQDLSTRNGKLQMMTSKLRLLHSQIAKLEQDIAQEARDQQHAEEELKHLQASDAADSTPASDAEQAETHADAASQLSNAPAAEATSSRADHIFKAESAPTRSLGVNVRLSNGVSEADETAARERQAQDETASGEQVGDATVDAVSTFPAATEDFAGKAKSSLEKPGSDDSEAESEEYEPMDVEASESRASNDEERVASGEEDVVPLSTDAEVQPAADKAGVPEQISVGINDTHPDEGLGAPTGEISSGEVSRSTSSDNKSLLQYTSPFEVFREYRYHPKYTEKVQGGLRSLTYSSNIDVNLPLCPDESTGLPCSKGSQCEFQHFNSMKIPDDQILLQLGSMATADPQEQQKYNTGLRELLRSLKDRNIQTFDGISKEIVKYRNQFNGDPSRVLSLGDIQL